MSKPVATAFAAMLLTCVPAMAATPIISGSYMVAIHVDCQVTLSANFTASGANGLNLVPSDADVPGQAVFSATFNSRKGKAATSGFVDMGTAFLLQLTGSQNGTQGMALGEQTQAGKSSYSNTATQLTFGGRTYNALYGQIDKKGIAHAVYWLGVYTGDGGNPCSALGHATLQ